MSQERQNERLTWPREHLGCLTYTQVIDLISGVTKRARIAGFDLVEFYPPADIDGISALTIARIVVNAIGSIVRHV